MLSEQWDEPPAVADCDAPEGAAAGGTGAERREGEGGRAGSGSLGAAARVGPVHIAEAIRRLQILQFSRMQCLE